MKTGEKLDGERNAQKRGTQTDQSSRQQNQQQGQQNQSNQGKKKRRWGSS